MATNIVAGMAADGGDPRLHPTDVLSEYTSPRMRKLHDHTISLEEYYYYAEKTRQEEANSDLEPSAGILSILWPSKGAHGAPEMVENSPERRRSSIKNEKDLGSDEIVEIPRTGSLIPGVNVTKQENRIEITDQEWTNASRALRTASTGAVFYLITTDVLGPFGIGYSLGLLGWGPGFALFIVFGFMAGYSGYLLWKCFLALDSYEFPCKNYADLGFRLYGRWLRHTINILQSIQLLFSVGILVLNMGQNLTQVAKFRLCYAAACVIWAAVGFGVGQIRTLQKFGWLANFAVFINIIIMIITLAVSAHSLPNYEIGTLGSVGQALGRPELITPDPATGKYPPVMHSAGMPASPTGFVGAIIGLMQGVYAYAGLQLYVEFMAEMRRPTDFLKSMAAAQIFIFTVYMIYGSLCYFYQGQYTYSNYYQGVSIYGWQVVGDMLFIVAGIIAAALYGNIGIKVIYNNVLMEFFNAPPLISKSGKILWAILVPVYWSIAFIVAAAIPYFAGLTSALAALCFVHFTYTFPPLLMLGHVVQKNAIRSQEGEGFDPTTGVVTRHDSGVKRIMRGFFAGGPIQAVFLVLLILYVIGALAVSGLGSYSAIEGLIGAFKMPQVNAFSCTSPLDLAG